MYCDPSQKWLSSSSIWLGGNSASIESRNWFQLKRFFKKCTNHLSSWFIYILPFFSLIYKVSNWSRSQQLTTEFNKNEQNNGRKISWGKVNVSLIKEFELIKKSWFSSLVWTLWSYLTTCRQLKARSKSDSLTFRTKPAPTYPSIFCLWLWYNVRLLALKNFSVDENNALLFKPPATLLGRSRYNIVTFGKRHGLFSKLNFKIQRPLPCVQMSSVWTQHKSTVYDNISTIHIATI